MKTQRYHLEERLLDFATQTIKLIDSPGKVDAVLAEALELVRIFVKSIQTALAGGSPSDR
ncbi:MAG: hypothetical protein KJ072_21225 [Verrucomicrobia bacterium]|nr:hypothetical protein [Verrucomicrobiota bacterium]